MTPEEQIQTASARLRADRETANQSRQVLVGIINDVCDATTYLLEHPDR